MIGLVSRMVGSVKMQINWCNEDQEEEDGYLGQATPRSSRERAIVAILDERYAPKVRQAVPLRKETAAVRASESESDRIDLTYDMHFTHTLGRRCPKAVPLRTQHTRLET